MSHKILFVTLSTLLLAALAGPLLPGTSTSLLAQEPEHVEEETPLQQNMSVINKGMRKLRRGLRKAESLPAALPVILEMQAAAHFCKTETPPLAARLEGDEKASFIQGYRLQVIGLQRLMLDLESAVVEGNMEQAQAVYQQMKATEDEGHEIYTEDEE